MPELKTVENLVEGWAKEAHLGEGLIEVPVFWDLVEREGAKYVVIPLAGGSVVAENGNMEVAREELYSLAYELVECGGDVTDGDVLRILTALLPAGIVVADESVEIDEPLWPVSIPTKGGPTMLSFGDIIHIERKEAKS